MGEPLRLSDDDRIIDVYRLIAAIKGERFAGVPLVEPLRTRLLELISHLAGRVPLSVGALTRYVPPLLRGLADERERFDHDLRQFALRLVQSPATGLTGADPIRRGQEEDDTELDLDEDERLEKRTERRWLIAAAVSTLTAILLGVLVWGARLPRFEDSTAPRTTAEIVLPAPAPEAMPVAKSPAPIAPRAERSLRVLSDEERRRLLAAAAGPALSAREQAGLDPAMLWLGAAVDQASWPRDYPLPLHEIDFVEELLGIGPARPGSPDDPQVARARIFARQVAEAAGKSATARLSENLVNPPDVPAGPAADVVFGRSFERPWEMGELARFTRATHPGPAFASASDELIARAWVIGSWKVERDLALVGAPWSPKADAAPLDLNRKTNGVVAGLLLLLSLALLRRLLRKAPLDLALLRAKDSVLKLVLHKHAPMPVLDSNWLRAWRNTLSRPVPSDPVISIEDSVAATAAANGFAELRYKLRRSVPAFTVAIERTGPRDIFAKWWVRVFNEIRRVGVPLDVTTYRHALANARVLIGLGGAQIKMPEIVSAERLIVIGKLGNGGAKDAPFAEPSLIIPAGRGGDPEPASLGRMGTAIQKLCDEIPPTPGSASLIFDDHRNWLDETGLDEVEWRRLRGALVLQLGAEGFRWLAGCALLPILEEKFLWHVAAALSIDSDAVATRQTACRLVALPWLRSGRLPQWMRVRLRAELSERDCVALQAMLAEQLNRGSASLGGRDDQVAIARNEVAIDLRDDRLLAQFSFARGGLLTPMMLSSRLRAWLLPAAWRRLGSARAVVALIPLGLAAAAFLLIPPLPAKVGSAFEDCVRSAGLVMGFVVIFAAVLGLYLTELRGDWWRIRGYGILELAESCLDKKLYSGLRLRLQLEDERSGVADAPARNTTWVAELSALRDRELSAGARGLTWLALVTSACLGCYMVSLRVAAERQELARVDRRIIQVRREIRDLQTELGTRGRMAQLEAWNVEVLGLAPPSSWQFLPGPRALNRLYGAQGSSRASREDRPVPSDTRPGTTEDRGPP